MEKGCILSTFEVVGVVVAVFEVFNTADLTGVVFLELVEVFGDATRTLPVEVLGFIEVV